MGKSSKDKRDAYYRLAKEQSYRARSAFKLLHLATIFPILPNPPTAPTFALDLCAAPGSWSQVLSQRLHPDSKILALDLQPISPIPGVITKQADITHPSTVKLIADVFGGQKAKLVVCDGAPDVMGLHDMDAYIQEELLLSALQLAKMVMDEGATFVAKIFRGQGELERGIWERMCGDGCFNRVTIAKPRSSRASSLEAFLVAEGWNGKRPGELADGPEWDFVACGDLTDWDSDATFVLEEGREVKDPVQSPVAPPYKKAIERRRLLGGQASSINPEKKREILGV